MAAAWSAAAARRVLRERRFMYSSIALGDVGGETRGVDRVEPEDDEEDDEVSDMGDGGVGGDDLREWIGEDFERDMGCDAERWRCDDVERRCGCDEVERRCG